jgi:exodeoxyribonuclease VII large subunit
MDRNSMSDETAGNVPEYSVSELSGAIKRTVEGNFGYVRVRGELGRVSRPASGHLYMDLKDDKAVLNGVMWKGTASRLKLRPEQGLEVICTGKMTTFPGQSRYQIVIDTMEPAGVGALMALLEERRKKLHAEGLFDDARKQLLPHLPQVIGVVTSPSGAVIRDIMHRLSDRFPRHVLLWPCLVQGEKAAEQITAGIKGFNALQPGGHIPRPDVIIVARGGGSIEDLWPFNEEIVVRAAAESDIPLISAVGHETDTTLIDYASDQRAPTPTAAAEMVVPVRSELVASVMDLDRRLVRALSRSQSDRNDKLRALTRAIPRPQDFMGLAQQRFDGASVRLSQSLKGHVRAHQARFTGLAARLRPEPLLATTKRSRERIGELDKRTTNALSARLQRIGDRLDRSVGLMEAISYAATLRRGYALIHGTGGKIIRSASGAEEGASAEIEFADGRVSATFGSNLAEPSSVSKKPKNPTKKRAKKDVDDPQGRLL